MKIQKLLQTVEIAAKEFKVPTENFKIVQLTSTSCKLRVGISDDEAGEVLLQGESLTLSLIKRMRL